MRQVKTRDAADVGDSAQRQLMLQIALDDEERPIDE
jgi:hypothetical protein